MPRLAILWSWSCIMKLLRRLLLLLVAVTATGIVVFGMNALAQDPDKSDKEKLKDNWILVSNESRGIIAEIFGQVPEPDKIRIVTFADDEMKLKIGDRSVPVGRFQIDPSKAPKSLDITIKTRGRKKATLQGIYEFDGNHLKMCFDSFGESRPAKFPVKA